MRALYRLYRMYRGWGYSRRLSFKRALRSRRADVRLNRSAMEIRTCK